MFSIPGAYPRYVNNFLNKKYPRNFILNKPYIGILIFFIFCFGFVTLYNPLKMHESRFLDYEATMAVYMSGSSFFIFCLIKLLRANRYFSIEQEWTILKEILAIVIILLGMGIFIFLIGFFLEVHGDRWNLITFWDSFRHAFLIGIFPLGFFTAINYRYLFVSDSLQSYSQPSGSLQPGQTEELVKIGSRLKKEELSFYPSQLVFAESEGNYVVFHLNSDDKIRKVMIRNSITEIENQLLPVAFIMRTHRAYIVNVKKVRSRIGNSLGYHLKLYGSDVEIPVSRQNTQAFNQLLKQFR